MQLFGLAFPKEDENGNIVQVSQQPHPLKLSAQQYFCVRQARAACVDALNSSTQPHAANQGVLTEVHDRMVSKLKTFTDGLDARHALHLMS